MPHLRSNLARKIVPRNGQTARERIAQRTRENVLVTREETLRRTTMTHNHDAHRRPLRVMSRAIQQHASCRSLGHVQITRVLFQPLRWNAVALCPLVGVVSRLALRAVPSLRPWRPPSPVAPLRGLRSGNGRASVLFSRRSAPPAWPAGPSPGGPLRGASAPPTFLYSSPPRILSSACVRLAPGPVAVPLAAPGREGHAARPCARPTRGRVACDRRSHSHKVGSRRSHATPSDLPHVRSRATSDSFDFRCTAQRGVARRYSCRAIDRCATEESLSDVARLFARAASTGVVPRTPQGRPPPTITTRRPPQRHYAAERRTDDIARGGHHRPKFSPSPPSFPTHRPE